MRFESVPQGRSFLQLLCLSASPSSEAFCLGDEQHYASRRAAGRASVALAASEGPSVPERACPRLLCPSRALGSDHDHEFHCVWFNKESHFPKIGNKWRHGLCHTAPLGADSLSPWPHLPFQKPGTALCLACPSLTGGQTPVEIPAWRPPPAPVPLLASIPWAPQTPSISLPLLFCLLQAFWSRRDSVP